MKFRGKLVKVDVYGVSVYFYKSKKIMAEDIARLDGAQEIDLQSGACIAMEPPHYGKRFMIGVFRKDDPGLQVLAHECSHACIHIAEAYGLKYGPESSEQFCYLMGYLFAEGKKALRL